MSAQLRQLITLICNMPPLKMVAILDKCTNCIYIIYDNLIAYIEL